MSVCVACVAVNVDPPKDATVTVEGTDYCNEHGVGVWRMSMSPGYARRTMRGIADLPPPPSA